MTDVREVIGLCNKFRERGWFPGGLGAVAQLYQVSDDSYKIYITPDKFGPNLTVNDFFLFRSLGGIVDMRKPLKQSAISKWHEVFLYILSKKETKSVAQIFLKWDALAARKALYTWKNGSNNHPNVFRIAHWDLVSRLTTEPGAQELNLPIIDCDESSLEKVKISLRSISICMCSFN